MRTGRPATVAALALAVVVAVAGCTGQSSSSARPAASPTPSSVTPSASTSGSPAAYGSRLSIRRGAPRPVPAVVPVFASDAARDAAFVSRAAELSWAPASAGPGFPATFRQDRLADARAICTAAGSGATQDALARSRDAKLSTADRQTLAKLAILDYCPDSARAIGLDPSRLPRRAAITRCPAAREVVVDPSMIGQAQIDRSGFGSAVRYYVTLINLTDYPVWVQPEVRWSAIRIVLYGYPTSSEPWRPRWERLSDRTASVATPARLLAPGASWRVQTIQNGAYSWTDVKARVNPRLFIPIGCA